MFDRNLARIPGSTGWEDFLCRIFHEWAADSEERHGPFVFTLVDQILHDHDYQHALREIWHGKPDPRHRGRYHALSRRERLERQQFDMVDCRHLVRRCGDWILTADPEDDDEESPSDRSLVFSAHTRPVQLSFHEVRDIVWNQAWWSIPGYDPSWERLLVQRLTDWLVAVGEQPGEAFIPWSVAVKKSARRSEAMMVLEREGRSIALSAAEARDIYYHGGWERFPGYEAHWQLALTRILGA